MEFIRQATANDSKQILDIYSNYIKHTAYTFEVDVPSVSDYTQRVKMISDYYPYILYIKDNIVIGYAYASKHRDRAAYCYNVDVSIYVENNSCGKGIGGKLYNTLFELLEKQGFYNAFAGIALPNERSEILHKKYNFKDIGIYENVGYKFDDWYDVKWMQKTMKNRNIKPQKIIPINALGYVNNGERNEEEATVGTAVRSGVQV